MQNCKEYVQIGVKVFIVIWHTFPVLLIIVSYTPVHREIFMDKHAHKEETNT